MFARDGHFILCGVLREALGGLQQVHDVVSGGHVKGRDAVRVLGAGTGSQVYQEQQGNQRISAPYFSFSAFRTFATISSACSSVRVWFSSRMVSEKATDFLPWTMWVPV